MAGAAGLYRWHDPPQPSLPRRPAAVNEKAPPGEAAGGASRKANLAGIRHPARYISAVGLPPLQGNPACFELDPAAGVSLFLISDKKFPETPMPSSTSERRLMSSPQGSRYFGLPDHTLGRLVRLGKLKLPKAGRCYVITDLDAVRRVLEAEGLIPPQEERNGTRK